jgi:phage N-6-adenine-methyltransferase
MSERLTSEEDARDSLESYNEGMRAIGERVKAGAPVPAFLRSQRGGLPAVPLDIKVEQAKANAIIDFATKIKDWPLLEQAIDLKIEQQREFVRWWDENVSVRESPGRGGVQKSVTVSVTDSGISKMQVLRWRKKLEDEVKYRAQQLLAAYRKAGLEPDANHRAEGTGENEWFTPAQYIEAARDVMGGIDLDPATHPVAQETVQAEDFFTAADDGLTQEWHGKVWLNPPYTQPLIARFAEKLVAEVSARRIEQAIMLTHNYTDTAWFHHAEAAADLICFTRGRIAFVHMDGAACSPTQGQAFFYYGPHIETFRDVFSRFGFVR